MITQNLFRSATAGLLVLALSACGSDDASTTASPAPGGAAGTVTDKIDVKDFAYKPKDATVKVGTPVTWTFSDSANHNVDPVGASELKKSPDLANGKTFVFTFTKPGMTSYRCDIHNSMTGTVNVIA